jgi:hypothetical protein
MLTLEAGNADSPPPRGEESGRSENGARATPQACTGTSMTTPSGFNDHAAVRGVELRLDTARAGLIGLPAGTVVTVGRVNYAASDLVKLLDSIDAPFKKKRELRAGLRALSQTGKQDAAQAKEFLADLKTGLKTLLGRKSEELSSFGFKPDGTPRTAPTVEQKVLRAAKRKMTREMRGTLGPRQKESLKATQAPQVIVDPDGSMQIVKPAGPTPTPRVA